MAARIVQITDLHLMADPRAELKGVCTRACLETVLDAVRRECGSVDQLIVTGDLAHDEQFETYDALRELLADWLPKLRLIPGNHDDRSAMREVFGERIESVAERNVFVDSVGGWRLIGLDSQLPGEVRGLLGKDQLDWLARKLAAQPSWSTMIFVHHPPGRVGSAWLDQIGLEDSEPFLELLQRFAQVRAICCGHIHQELTVVEEGLLVLATPATGVQFRPETENLLVDFVPPGFRILDLVVDGSFRTRVVRVPLVRGEMP